MEKNVSEEEIVTLLEKRIVNIKAALFRAEKALTAIKSPGESEGPAVKKNGKKLKKRPEPPLKYDVNLKWHDKILFILSKFGEAFKENIFEELTSLEPDADKGKLMNSLSVQLSLLLKQEKIKAEKVGKKFKYFLVK